MMLEVAATAMLALSYKESAAHLNISARQYKTRVGHLYERAEVQTQAQFILKYLPARVLDAGK